MSYTRRQFLESTSVLGAASLLGYLRLAQAEPPPEVKKIRLVKIPAICFAPEYVAEELLRLEGFSEVEYVEMDRAGTNEMLIANRADISADAPPSMIPALDTGGQLIALAGIHAGCYELFVNQRINAVRDLKGKRVAVPVIGSIDYYFVASMVAYAGMYPRKDINWVEAKTFEYHAVLHRWQSRCIPGASAAAAKATREEDRSCHRQYRARSAMEWLLLLHDRRPVGICGQEPRGNQTRCSRHSQSHRLVRARTGARGAVTGRQRLRAKL